MSLAYRAGLIMDILRPHLEKLELEPVAIPQVGSNLLDLFTNLGQQPNNHVGENTLVTRVWAHAALIYLSVVVSGWQPASDNVRYHVRQIIVLLTNHLTEPALLRTMVWPFCVAGCLADQGQECQFRRLSEALQPPSLFGTVRKALEIMEKVWASRDSGDNMDCDLATCFRSQGDLVLLV